MKKKKNPQINSKYMIIFNFHVFSHLSYTIVLTNTRNILKEI